MACKVQHKGKHTTQNSFKSFFSFPHLQSSFSNILSKYHSSTIITHFQLYQRYKITTQPKVCVDPKSPKLFPQALAVRRYP